MNSKQIRLQIGSLLVLFIVMALGNIATAAQDVKEPAAVDWLDIAYQKAKIISGHATVEETLALINQLTDLGHLKTARSLLDKHSSFPIQYHLKRLDAELKLTTAEYFKLKDDKEAQEVHKAKIKKILLQISNEKEIDAVDLVRYESQAEQFEVFEAVVTLSKRLAAMKSTNSSQWWSKAAEWSLASRQTQEAIFFYQKAYDTARSKKDRQRYHLLQLKALFSDGQFDKIEAEIKAAMTSGSDPEILVQLAQLGLYMERPDLAWRLYGRLIITDSNRRQQWQTELVRWAIAANQPLEAARFLRSLPLNEFSPEQQTVLLRNQFTLLKNGNQPLEALKLAENIIERFPTDVELLQQSVALGLATNNITLADKWNKMLLEMEPQQEVPLKKQVEISLARQEPKKAIESIRKLYLQNPNDHKIEQQLAHLEEWAGNPREALIQWKHLSQVTKRLDSFEQVYRLSQMLNEYQTAIETLKYINDFRKLSVDEIKERIVLYEKLGEPEKAAAKTKEYLATHPKDHQIWRELANLDMRSREYQQALKTWEEIATRFGRDKEETLFRSECYWRLGKRKQALDVLESYQGDLSGSFNLYHADLLLELGWRYHRPKLAEYCLETLLDNYNSHQFFNLERLIYLKKEGGNQEKAIQLAMRLEKETGDSRFLMLALNLAADGFNREKIDQLLKKMETESGHFDSVPHYWIIKAEREYAQSDFKKAEAFYQQALNLDADSLTAKEGILWSLLSLGDKEKLAVQLNEWESYALRNQELWLVYALSRQFLNQYHRAGVWYERLITIGSKDYGVILGYADVLEAVGSEDRAYRLRMWAMQELRPEAVAFLQKNGKLTENLKSYIVLRHRYGSAEIGEQWLSILMKLDENEKPTAWIYELAISWYLNRKCHHQAKIWLAKAHEKRLKTPKWQEIVLALEENDTKKLEAILKDGSQIDLENKVAILTKLNRRQEALHLAEMGIDHNYGYAQSSTAKTQVASLKQDFPAYWDTGYATTFSDQLESRNAYADGRYSFASKPIGFDIKVKNIQYDSSTYIIDDRDQTDDLAVSTFLGDGRHGGNVALGINHNDVDDIGYGQLEYHLEFGQETMGRLKGLVHSVPDVNSILQLATLQNRLDAVLSGTFAMNYYYYLDLWGREYNTRNDNLAAKGFGTTAEIGFKQQWGRFNWQAGVQGNSEYNYDRKLPKDLEAMLPAEYSIDDVIAQKTTSLLLGGRISRGAIRENYPLTGSCRYFTSAWIGHTWPQDKLTVNLEAGSGVRVIGNDELSLQIFSNQSGGVVGRNDDNGISLEYRYYY
jgi:tetratricopeptide (TPR) repeat protein